MFAARNNRVEVVKALLQHGLVHLSIIVLNIALLACI